MQKKVFESNKKKEYIRHQFQRAIGILHQHSLYDEFIYPDWSERSTKEYPHTTARGGDRPRRFDLRL